MHQYIPVKKLIFLSFFDVFFFLSEASLSNNWKRFCVLIGILTNLVSYQERQGLLLFKISCTIPIIQFPEITKHPAYPLGSEKSKYYSFAILFSISTWSICKNSFLLYLYFVLSFLHNSLDNSLHKHLEVIFLPGRIYFLCIQQAKN